MEPPSLSLEKQFAIRSFAEQVSQMSHRQAQDFLIQLYGQYLYREAMYAQLLKHQWGIE